MHQTPEDQDPISDWRVPPVANDGERVTHLYPNDLYYAHLSLYAFARPMASGASVLDAGCGAGYGAAYLADGGARSVLAIDVDRRAVDFSRRHFRRPGLRYESMDACDVGTLPAASFDVVFSSNTMEHVPDVASSLRGVVTVLRPDGVLVLAVPPVTDEAARVHELLNPHHLHVWSPAQWAHTLGRYFRHIEMYRHWFARAGANPDFRGAPGASTVTEADFAFELVAEPVYVEPTLTALFVAREPLPERLLPKRSSAIHYVDDSVSRRPPGGPAVSPAVAFVEPRPIAQMPGRAVWIVRHRGVTGLLAEAQSYVRWLTLRRQAQRLLRTASRRRSSGIGETPPGR